MHHTEFPSATPVNVRRKIFEFIVEAHPCGQPLPSRDDLRRLFGGLTADVDMHLEQLAREGLLILDRDGNNGISLVPTYTQVPEIKVLGKVADSLRRSEGSTFTGSIVLDLRGIGLPTERGMFAVQVLDDRMTDAGIEYGDIALLVNKTPLRGDIVAVEEAEIMVLRRYVVVSGIPHFLAENSTAPNLRPGWDTQMHGVLWGLVRAESRRRSARLQPAKKPISYSNTSECVESAKRQAGNILRAESGSSKAMKVRPRIATQKKSTAKTTRKTKSGWPKPPSGVQLNETEGNFRSTEEPGIYDTWDRHYLVGNSSKAGEQ